MEHNPELWRQVTEAEDALERIEAYIRINVDWEDYLVDLVRLARHQGCTWADIGAAFGVTRQAAHRRFARDL
jgi:hypothetical protein